MRTRSLLVALALLTTTSLAVGQSMSGWEALEVADPAEVNARAQPHAQPQPRPAATNGAQAAAPAGPPAAGPPAAAGPGAEPAPVATDRFQNQPIRSGTTARPTPGEEAGGQSGTPGDAAETAQASGGELLAPRSMAGEAIRVVAALVVVLGIILLLRKLVQRMVPSAAALPAKSVKLVGRTALGPRQQVLVLQVGRRLVVVGDSGQQLSPLMEVSDPDEVAAILGQAAEPSGAAFGTVFQRQRDTFEDDEDDARAAGASAAGARDAETRQAPTRPSIASRLDAAEDPEMNQAQSELSGLAERIKLLSSQFKRGTGG